MYAGLTTADKGALLDAKARGAEWIAADQDTTIWAYYSKPYKRAGCSGWGSDGIGFAIGVANENNLSFFDSEPVNIDLALAQIAEMESKTVTWNEVILERYRKDVSRHASARVFGEKKNGKLFFYRMGCADRYDTFAQAEKDEIEYLNSIAEVEK